MSIEPSTRYQRRTSEQWQNIIEQFQETDLSGVKYCEQYGVPYASFCKWRKKLSSPLTQESRSTSDFIDLGLLSQQAIQSEHSQPWHIVLKLGNGVELCLTQNHAPV